MKLDSKIRPPRRPSAEKPLSRETCFLAEHEKLPGKVSEYDAGDPTTWTREEQELALSQIGLERNSRDWRDYSKATRLIRDFYPSGWIPGESNYHRLIEWIRDYLDL